MEQMESETFQITQKLFYSFLLSNTFHTNKHRTAQAYHNSFLLWLNYFFHELYYA